MKTYKEFVNDNFYINDINNFKESVNEGKTWRGLFAIRHWGPKNKDIDKLDKPTKTTIERITGRTKSKRKPIKPRNK